MHRTPIVFNYTGAYLRGKPLNLRSGFDPVKSNNSNILIGKATGSISQSQITRLPFT